MSNSEDWQCSACGHSNTSRESAPCEGCGEFRFGTLVLIGAGDDRIPAAAHRFRIDAAVGRATLRSLVSKDYVYADDEQFHVHRDRAAGGWIVSHHATAKNTTFCNGKALSNQSVLLRNGAVISIGPDRAKVSVQFEM